MNYTKTAKLIAGKKIAIVGGGPGGLSLARLLQMKGAEVQVYERDYDSNARVQGAIVDLHHDSGLKVISAAGLLESFKKKYMPGADAFRFLDKDAGIYFDETQQAAGDFEDVHFRPEIDRGALRDLLIEALLPGTVIWDSQFVRMEQRNDQWELHFKNGTKAMADIVIGSDGHRSKIRPYVTDITARYSGAIFIQGEVNDPKTACPEMYALVNNANLIAMGIGKTVAAQPRGDGGLTFYASALYPEDWLQTSGIDFKNSQAVSNYLKDFYKDWNPVFHSLFNACDHFTARPLNYFPADQNWTAKDNVTIIGDAAHLMPPSGEGVNTAMLDALDLCEHLTNDTYYDLQAAIGAYEQKMRSRAALLAEEAIEGIKTFSAPTEDSIKEFLQLYANEQRQA